MFLLDDMSALPPESGKIPTKSAGERFVIGAIFGAMAGFFGVLLYSGHLGESAVFGLVLALISGSVGALFGKRAFDFVVDLLSSIT